jgi:tetratricopeptide (TPR) repeat protein
MRKLFVLLFGTALATHAATRSPELQAAAELYNQRKNPEAKAAFEKLAAADAKNAEPWHFLGQLAIRADEAETAVKHHEKAVALDPANSNYQWRLGDAYGRSAQKAGVFSKMGLAGKCRTAYEKAVELDPKNLEARSSLMNYYQQAPGIAGGSKDKALAQAQEIKQLDASRGRFAFATLYLAENKYNQAFAEFEEVLKEKPDDYAALFQTGRLAAISGERLDHGLTVLRQCLTMPPPEGQPGHAAAHWRIGFILEKKSDKVGARAAYEASLKLDPKFPQAIESLRKL